MKVTILIVNYKNWQDTIECLESVFKSSHKDLEIIVVDNSPNDISINNLQEWAKGNIRIGQTRFPELVFPEITKPLDFFVLSEKKFYTIQTKKDITFVKAESNNGFAAANNIVLSKLLKSKENSDFIFLLNNDTVIPKDTIKNLIDNYNNTNFGVVGCVLLEYNDPKKVQSVGGLYNKVFGTTIQASEGISLTDFNNKTNNTEIDYPVGAAMFLSIDVLKNVGVLCEDYFLYYEELDWVKRASKQYKTTYFKNCLVYHKGGVSIGSNKKSYIADKFSIVNRINFAKKYNKKYLIMVYLGVFLSIFKRLLLCQFARAFQLTKAIFNNEA